MRTLNSATSARYLGAKDSTRTLERPQTHTHTHIYIYIYTHTYTYTHTIILHSELVASSSMIAIAITGVGVVFIEVSRAVSTADMALVVASACERITSFFVSIHCLSLLACHPELPSTPSERNVQCTPVNLGMDSLRTTGLTSVGPAMQSSCLPRLLEVCNAGGSGVLQLGVFPTPNNNFSTKRRLRVRLMDQHNRIGIKESKSVIESHNRKSSNIICPRGYTTDHQSFRTKIVKASKHPRYKKAL